MEELKAYITALANYYGLIPHEKAAEIYRIHHGREIDPKVYELFADQSLHDEDAFADYMDEDQIINADGLFFHDQAEFRGGLKEFTQKKLAREWHIPDKDTLMAFADLLHIEHNEAYLALDGWLRKQPWKNLSQPADTFADLISNLVRQDWTVAEVLKEVGGMGLKGSTISAKAQLQELIEKLAAKTRRWELNGFNAEEYLELLGEAALAEAIPADRLVVITAKKAAVEVGRNDPCPCGSGKKYKKCCMNKDLSKS